MDEPGRRDDDYFVSLPAHVSEPGPELPPPGLAPARPRGPSVLSVLVTLLVSAGLVAAVVAWIVSAPDGSSSPDGSTVAEADSSRSRDRPHDPVVDGYEVWARNDDGTAVRWDPCEPIRWVFNPEDAPATAEADIARATAEVAAATGLRFEPAGRTDEEPVRDRPPYQPDRYGEDHWAPVLIAWSRPGETDVPLADTDRGVSIPVAVGDGTEDVFVTGQIVFNPDRPLWGGYEDRRTSWGATILHELGHTVGLDHVGDPTQLMYTFPGEGEVRFGPGDLRGLRELGQGGCLDVPRPVDVDVTYVDDFGR